MLVSRHGVSTSNWICWTLIIRNYRWLYPFHTSTHSTDHPNCNTHIFAARCLVTARNNEHSSASVLTSYPDGGWLAPHDLIAMTILTGSVGRSVKFLLDFASTVIPGFRLLEIRDQDFYSASDMYVFRNGASSSTKEGSVFLCRRYVCCTVVSAWVHPRCHGVQVTIESVHHLSLHCTK
jgi:hypothetical protein